MSRARAQWYVIAWDGVYSSVRPAGPDDKGMSFRACKRELLEHQRSVLAGYRDAVTRLRVLTKADVDNGRG